MKVRAADSPVALAPSRRPAFGPRVTASRDDFRNVVKMPRGERLVRASLRRPQTARDIRPSPTKAIEVAFGLDLRGFDPAMQGPLSDAGYPVAPTATEYGSSVHSAEALVAGLMWCR